MQLLFVAAFVALSATTLVVAAAQRGCKLTLPFHLSCLFAAAMLPDGEPGQKTMIVPPNRLARSLQFTAEHDLWNTQLAQRLSSDAASEGVWIASLGGDGVAHVEISEPGQAGIRLFCRDPSSSKASAATMEVAGAAIEFVREDRRRKEQQQEGQINPPVALSFGSLDRRLLPDLRTWLGSQYSIKRSWESPCGMWVFQGETSDGGSCGDAQHETHVLPQNCCLRLLSQDDAALVNSRWEYRSERSLAMIRKMIAVSESTFGGCMGLEVDNVLVAWSCRYLDGSLGMLWTEEGHRKKGYGRLVVNASIRSILDRRHLFPSESKIPTHSWKQPLVAFTVDGNSISQGLLAKLNWQRVADADWVGFSLLPKAITRSNI